MITVSLNGQVSLFIREEKVIAAHDKQNEILVFNTDTSIEPEVKEVLIDMHKGSMVTTCQLFDLKMWNRRGFEDFDQLKAMIKPDWIKCFKCKKMYIDHENPDRCPHCLISR